MMEWDAGMMEWDGNDGWGIFEAMTEGGAG